MEIMLDNLMKVVGCNGTCSNNELMVYQMMYRNLTNNIMFNVVSFSNIRELYSQFEEYPFKYDIEFYYFYNNSQYLNSTTPYESLIPQKQQLIYLFNISDNGELSKESTNTSFFYANNIIDMYYYCQSSDLISAFNRFKLTSKQSMYFLCDYLYEYNLNNFGLIKFQEGEIVLQGTTQERAFSLFLPIAIRESINKIKENIKPILISKIIYHYYILLVKKDCNFFVSKVINDSRLQIICGENSTETNMMTYHSVKNWVFPVFNQNSYENFKNQLNFTDLEMVSFYSNFLSNINFAEDVIKNEYNCVNSCESEYLAMLQWGQGRITLSPPKIINETTNSLFFWESSKFDGKFKLK
jgi:hypothetical protein